MHRDSGLPDPEALHLALQEPLEAVLPGFAASAAQLDPGLGKSASKTQRTMQEAARKLVERYRRTLAQRDEVTTQRLDRALARLAPHGAPQERVHSWPTFAARYGGRRFVAAVCTRRSPSTADCTTSIPTSPTPLP